MCANKYKKTRTHTNVCTCIITGTHTNVCTYKRKHMGGGWRHQPMCLTASRDFVRNLSWVTNVNIVIGEILKAPPVKSVNKHCLCYWLVGVKLGCNTSRVWHGTGMTVPTQAINICLQATPLLSVNCSMISSHPIYWKLRGLLHRLRDNKLVQWYLISWEQWYQLSPNDCVKGGFRIITFWA